MIIKNYAELSLTPQRKILLDILNYGLECLDYSKEIAKLINEGRIKTPNREYFLKNFDRIFLLGFGKGSSYIGKEIFNYLLNYPNFKKCFLIDLKYDDLILPQEEKLTFFEGTHPFVSQNNIQATKEIINYFSKEKLTENDLVIVIICGGGSAMFTLPAKIDFQKKVEITKKLFYLGADIFEINTVRKHLSLVKGGGLAKILFPSYVLSLIVSDVPGDKLEFIASGPTSFDKTTIDDAFFICQKYGLNLTKDKLIETPKDDRYFVKVENYIFLSNQKILKLMEEFALKQNIKAKIIKTDINLPTQVFVDNLKNDLNEDIELYLYGGETTVEIKKPGKGGRNQDLVLRFLKKLQENYFDQNLTILAFNSDGWDNTEFGGAIGDKFTIEKAKNLNLDINFALEENQSFDFFQKTKDGILTGRLPLNVSDFILIFKSKTMV